MFCFIVLGCLHVWVGGTKLKLCCRQGNYTSHKVGTEIKNHKTTNQNILIYVSVTISKVFKN